MRRYCASAMVLIDSSPWIDMLSGSPTPEAEVLTAWLREARDAFSPTDDHSLARLLRWPSSLRRFSSSGVSFGRSMTSVSFVSLPVNSNGTL